MVALSVLARKQMALTSYCELRVRVGASAFSLFILFFTIELSVLDGLCP